MAEEALERQIFDFDLRNYMELDEGDPQVSHANTAASLEFNPKAQSLGAMSTTAYTAYGEGGLMERAALKPLVTGMTDLQEALRVGATAATEDPPRPLANNGGTAHTEPPLSNDNGHCGGHTN